MNEQTTLGIIESVAFPDLFNGEVLAKIDTGAYSGALHCESIEEIVDKDTGKRVLKVVPIDPSHSPVLFQRFSRTVARSSTGHENKRYIVKTQVVIQGKTYEMSIGLTQRTMMNVKVLIGRRFIRKNNMLVDVTRNQKLDNDGGRKL